MSEPRKVCAVCGYPLEALQPVGSTEITWFHMREMYDAQAGDHVVVPVDIGEIEHNVYCDFCGADENTHILLCRGFTMPLQFAGQPEQRSAGNWAACGVCAAILQRNHWVNYMVRRVRAELARKHPHQRGMSNSLLRETYERVERHSFGLITIEEWKARPDWKHAEPDAPAR